MNMTAHPSKTGRNDFCPCGSGAKFKKCCGLVPQRRDAPSLRSVDEHLQAGRLDEAEAELRAILQADRRNTAALHRLGQIAKRRGDDQGAVAVMLASLSIEPESAPIHSRLGSKLCVLGRPREGAIHLERAIALDPTDHGALSNLGYARAELGRPQEAISCFKRAVALKPDEPKYLHNLASLLAADGRPTEAVNCYRRALMFNPPDLSMTHGDLAKALAALGQLEEAIVHYERALSLRPDDANTNSNLLLLLNYRARFEPEHVYTAHRRYADRFETPLRPSWQQHANDRSHDRPLRIGYVSSDLRMHSVAFFIESVLAQHDREHFHVHVYSNFPRMDEVSRRLRSHVMQWREIVRLSDDQVAQGIREDRIDILVDLNGHTGMNRLLLFARKPAPVQVSWLGYPNTTGLAAMDYRLTDRFADPEGMTERYHTETLLRLPECFSCYRPPEAAPEVNALPSGEGGAITFGSFNNRAKIGPEVIALWARILHAVPASRLMLKGKGYDDESVQETLREAFRAHGIGEERLQLHGGNDSHAEHLRRYHEIDIALDPFPYNGTTTTCDALWMGVPVVTLEGATHAARTGVSLLNHLELTEWIAGSAQEYIEIAVQWASDTQRLAALRRQLRTRVASSPLIDARTFTRHLESAYRSMWWQWCGVS